jgi:hypothetical protein
VADRAFSADAAFKEDLGRIYAPKEGVTKLVVSSLGDAEILGKLSRLLIPVEIELFGVRAKGLLQVRDRLDSLPLRGCVTPGFTPGTATSAPKRLERVPDRSPLRADILLSKPVA